MIQRFFSVIGCILVLGVKADAQQEIWDSYTAAYPGGAGVVTLNMALKQQAPLKDYGYVMMLVVNCKQCASDGLPEDAEMPALAKLSDTVKAVMARDVKSKLVGTYTHKCQRQEFYYLSDTSAVRTAVVRACTQYFPGYHIDIKMKEDAAWKMYTSFLYPTDQIFDYMQNQKVLMQLQLRGDALTAERPVQHWLYFASEADREHFIAYAIAAKFAIEDKKISKESKLVYELQISRTEKVNIDAISKTTWELRQQAKLNHGEYDGWQAHVMK